MYAMCLAPAGWSSSWEVSGRDRSLPWANAERVTIPQRRFDSLNVAMAGTVLAYELEP